MAETHQTPATPPAPPAQPDPAVIKPRAEEQQPSVTTGEQAAKETKERMAKTQGFWNRLAPEKEGEKPAKPEKPKKEEKPAVAAPATPEPEKKPKARKKEQEIDPLELARATGQEIGREMAKASQAQNVPRGTIQPDTETESELPEEFRPDVAVFEEMAKLDPKRYGNIKKELGKYAKAESEYISQWEKDNEGQTFDGEADEHDAFYAKIRPNYEQKDFKAAEKSLLKKEVRNEVSQELRVHEAESERRRERASQIQPEVDQSMFNTLGDMIRETDPDSAALAKDWDSIKSLDEQNPLLADVLVTVHNSTKPAVVATMRLFRQVEAPDPQNPVHQRVFTLIQKAEQEVSKLPIKERYDDNGRLFATQEQYAKMSPDDKARHWYIGEPETLAIIRGGAIRDTKKIYEAEKQKIERYSKRQTNAAQPTKPAEQAKPETPAHHKADNGSPSVSGRGTLPGDGQAGGGKPQTGRDLLFSRLLGS